MMVHEFLERSADQRPDQVALICDGQRLTYRWLEAAANRLANGLRALGVQRGDRVAIFLPNSVEAVVSIFAVLKAGAVFVMLNPTLKAPKLTQILNNCQPPVLIAAPGMAGLVQQVKPAVAALKRVIFAPDLPGDNMLPPDMLSYTTLQTAYPANRPRVYQIDLDLACLIYTSGSTGEPKGVMSDHSNVDFVTSAIIQYLQNREDDIVLNVLPLSFDYGLYQLLMVFKFGGTLVLEKNFVFPTLIVQRMSTEKVTGFAGVPSIYAMLLPMDLSGYDLSSLRYLTNTAAALPAEHLLQICQRFPKARVYSMYGLTETKRTLYLPPEQIPLRPRSVGIAIPGTEVWVEGEDGQRLRAGQVGELVARGRHVMRGYWNDPLETARRFRPGALPGERCCYTGDLFWMDEDGYFYFVARKDDIIKSRGEKVAPIEVENVLYAFPGVIEAAVVGIPDPLAGQVIKACVVCQNPAVTEKELLAFCRSQLEDFMVPKRVEFYPVLPKTDSGKIKKSALI